MKRLNISSGTKWEPIVGYSRAVRIGNQVFVTGTTATDAEGNIVGKGNPAAQTLQAIENIRTALRKAGADLEDVVRTRMFVIDIDQWEEIGKAHARYFSNILPATTMVQISRLIHPDMLVEIEADAVVGG